MRMQNRADRVIAQGATTNSKNPRSYIEGIYPTHVSRGTGAHIYNNRGEKWLDFVCGLGTNLFGYGNPEIGEQVERAFRGGVTYGVSSSHTVELAERIKNKFAHMEKMKFLKSGSEGCSAAIRIARAFTGRDLVASEHYHGWHDDFTSLTKPASGVPKRDFITKGFRNGSRFSDYAALIIEPFVTDIGPERREELRAIREICTTNGVVLIFDETITAYRFPGGLASKFVGVDPDISIFGKAVAGGLPLSIVGGKKQIMDADYFVSTTWGDDNLANLAAIKCLDLLSGDYNPMHLWSRGKLFLEEFNSLGCVKIEGYPTRGVFTGSDRDKALFFQEACLAGMLFGPSWFYNLDLDKHRDEVLSACKIIIQRVGRGQVKLKGKMPFSPFAQKVRKETPCLWS